MPSDVQAQIRALEVLSEDQIDTTDAPEILDWSDAKRGVFYRREPSGGKPAGKPYDSLKESGFIGVLDSGEYVEGGANMSG